MWYEFPEDADSFALEGQHMVGDALLVHPVSKSGSESELVYFPGNNQRWFDIHTNEEITSHGGVNVPVIYDHIPGEILTHFHFSFSKQQYGKFEN